MGRDRDRARAAMPRRNDAPSGRPTATHRQRSTGAAPATGAETYLESLPAPLSPTHRTENCRVHGCTSVTTPFKCHADSSS